MKWYLGITEDTFADYADMIAVALYTARIRTDLKPHILFDGEEGEITRRLTRMGATIIFNRISFAERLQKTSSWLMGEGAGLYMRTALGAFQRLDIALIEKEEEFVVYTDCDVFFRHETSFEKFKPRTFFAAPQFQRNGHAAFEINSGVMVINVPRMRDDLAAMVDLGCELEDGGGLGFDQEFLAKFYRHDYAPLPLKYNWKPYWGRNDTAHIIHWHGPKPHMVQWRLTQADYTMASIHQSLYDCDPASYFFYLKEWETFKESAAAARS